MRSRRSLISSYHGHEVLLITPLLRWYIEHGLVVTKVHMTLEWEPRRCFEHLAQNMADSRRQADVDPNWKLMGNACKLIANAVYGKCIQNKQKMTQTHMCRGKKVQLLINSSRYRGHKRLQPNAEATCQASGRRQEDKQVPVLQLIQDSNVPAGIPYYEAQEEALALNADAIYELFTTPQSISEDLPVQIALYVYQYAKLHILSFKYDFLDAYFNKWKWQLLYSDTDSFYLQLSVEWLEEASIPEKRRAYFENHATWLPSECCGDHRDLYAETMTEAEEWANSARAKRGGATAAMAWMPGMVCCQRRHDHDQRTPGLFKVEFQGQAMVCLCSKTYFCLGDEWGESCKGILKSRNRLTFDHYLRALCEDGPGVSIQMNKGIRIHPKTGLIETYTQQRRGLTNIYLKRKVREDGVSTDRSIYDVTARRQIEVAIPSFDSRVQWLWEKHSDGRTGRERNGSDEQAALHDHRVPCSRTTNICQGKQCSHRSKGKCYLLTFSIVSHSRHEMCMESDCKSIDELIFSKDAYVFTWRRCNVI